MYTLLITFFLVSLVFSFLCSLWEAVLLSITPTWARLQRQAGHGIGRRLEDFKANIDRPLAAILTLNTIAHTVGAIGVGAQATAIWGETHPLITGLAVPVVMTLAILLFSEIVPKTIGALHWKAMAPFTVRCLQGLLWALAPLVWLSQYITKALKHGQDMPVLTRTDFVAMAELGAQDGVFEEDETQIIGNLLSFQGVSVADVMTPRTVVVAADETQTISDWFDGGKRLRFSRLPTFVDGSMDRTTGYVLKADLLVALVEGRGNQSVGSLRRDIVVVGEDHPVPDLLRQLMARHEHIAVVLDQFGGMAGVVTMEDLIETLLGMEIVDETDATTDMRVLAQRHRARRAKTLGVLDGPGSAAVDSSGS